MKGIFWMGAVLLGLTCKSQQIIYNDRFDQLSLQTYTTGSSSVKFAAVPSGYTLINDGLANNPGSDSNPNAPFHAPTMTTSGWAVVYNAIENDTFLVSSSWLDTTGLNTDRWVVTPLITNISANTVLTWLAKCPDASYRDGYEVYGTTNTGALNAQSFSIGDRLFALADANSNGGGELAQWTRRSVDLTPFAGQQLRFAFRNNSKDMYQLWIDDLEVVDLNNSLDAAISPVVMKKYILSGSSDTVSLRLSNRGASAISSINLSYQIGNSTINTENFSFGTALNYGQASGLRFGLPYAVTQNGYYTMKVWVNSVNGTSDQNLSNDTLRYGVTIQGSAPAKNVMIEQFTSANNPTGVDAQARTMTLQDQGAIVVNIHDQDALVVAGSSSLVADYKKQFATALIDRCYFEDAGSVALPRSYYATRFANRLAVVVPASVSIVNKNYNSTTRLLSFTVKADFVGEVRGDYRLNAYLTENQVSGLQSDTTVNGYNQLNGSYTVPWSYYYLMGYYSAALGEYVLKADQFRHHNTLVHAFDGSYGSAGTIPSAGGTQGQSYQQTFTLSLPTYSVNKFHEENLYIVAYVAEYDTDLNHRTVLNSVKDKMVAGGEVLGLNETSGTLSVKIWPNPSSGELWLEGLNPEKQTEVRVIDATGRELRQIQLPPAGSSRTSLDLSAFDEGLYLLQLRSGGQSSTLKVLLQKKP